MPACPMSNRLSPTGRVAGAVRDSGNVANDGMQRDVRGVAQLAGPYPAYVTPLVSGGTPSACPYGLG